MSDLSWLNPTPHAIAAYASRPLSPVATQHSLPSGRYPLLGPDFHRLDRTSLRLAHSLDHLVGVGSDRDSSSLIPCRSSSKMVAPHLSKARPCGVGSMPCRLRSSSRTQSVCSSSDTAFETAGCVRLSCAAARAMLRSRTTASTPMDHRPSVRTRLRRTVRKYA